MRILAFVLMAAVAARGQAPIRGFSAETAVDERGLEAKARQIPSADRLLTYMERMASTPHVAGSPASRKVAEYALSLFQDWGLDAHIETFEALIPYPTVRVLETTGTSPIHASLTEPAIAEDPDTQPHGQMAPFNAYGATGDVTAPLVYVNYGTPDDYTYLETQGISVKGRIVIARYGRVWRGLKPKLAQEHGALGCVLYSDPRDDGFFVDEVYPRGPMRPSEGVQRGSVMDMVLYPGDPLTPGWASEPGAKRLRRDEAKTLLKIPVLPISWADARPFLELLQGPIAPESWRGAIPLTYHMGPSKVNVHLKMDFDWANRPLYDVIATIPGTKEKDHWILYGNHHDAWVTGASDPISGASALLETARSLSLLVRQGWKPERTVKLALWDGEEYGLLGSTEWVEKHAHELETNGAVYLNTDSSGTGAMSVAGSSSLETFANEVLRDVNDPRGGRSIYESMKQPGVASPSVPTDGDLPIGALGSGSDYVGFLHHEGVASLNFGFGAAPGQYHSSYDTVRFYNEFSDGDRRYSVALTQVMTIAILRLADAPLLPFDFVDQGRTLSRQVDELLSRVPRNTGANFEPLVSNVGRFALAARAFESAYDAAARGEQASGNQAAGPPASPAASHGANDAMRVVERGFLLTGGLPGRDWYKNSLYAPGLSTGYSAKTLPGVREAIEAKNWPEANAQAQELAGAVREATALIERATGRLEGK